jgi:hypothetical protein
MKTWFYQSIERFCSCDVKAKRLENQLEQISESSHHLVIFLWGGLPRQFEIGGQIRIYVPQPWQRRGDLRDDKVNPMFLAYSQPMRDENSLSNLALFILKFILKLANRYKVRGSSSYI